MTGIGIIGLGYWGKNHIKNYKALLNEKKIDYLKVCDINEERAKEIGKLYNLNYTSNIQDLINDDQINAVVIITPSSSHYELSKLFLENEKDVFVEKPMTLKSEKAEELVQIAQNKNRILMVGHLFRYHPLIVDIKKRIDIGEFGEIEMILTYRFALGVPRKDMGVIFALAVHDLDLACYLLNKRIPKSILVDAGKFHQENVFEMANISLDFDSGTKAYMMESWNIPVYNKKRELVIIGTEKSALIDYLKPSEFVIFDTKIKKKKVGTEIFLEKEDNEIQKIMIDYKEPLNEEILHFISCIKNHEDPLTDGKVGYNAIKMCEKAIQSASQNKRIYF